MKRILPVLALSVACSSASTHLTDVYRNPEAKSFQFQRVAAIAIVEDPDIRRTAEDAMVQQLHGKGVASYTILTAEDEKSPESVRAKLAANNVDGAVTMRLLSLGEEPMDVRGEISDSEKAFSGYYGASHRGVASAWESVARIETQIFSVRDGKLLWSAASKTFSPADAKGVVNAAANAVASELRKEGLIQ